MNDTIRSRGNGDFEVIRPTGIASVHAMRLLDECDSLPVTIAGRLELFMMLEEIRADRAKAIRNRKWTITIIFAAVLITTYFMSTHFMAKVSR